MHSVFVVAVTRKRKIKRTVIVQDGKKGVRKQNYVTYCRGLTETDKRENVKGRRKEDMCCLKV